MRLILLRHAKSSWAQGGRTDFDRPLASRGKRDAPLIAADMIAKGLTPTLILVSAAQRTRETLGHILHVFRHDAEIRICRALYDAGAQTYINMTNELSYSHDEILLLGHNPSIQEAALMLLGEGNEGDKARLNGKFPTAAYAAFKFPGNTAEIGTGALEWFIEPRSLTP